MASSALQVLRAQKPEWHAVIGSFCVDKSLRQALDDFQDALEPEEKQRLSKYGTIPDPSAVIILPTEIDNENAKRRSRCVGARIASFLESIQQFSFIVDAFCVIESPNCGVNLGQREVNSLGKYDSLDAKYQ